MLFLAAAISIVGGSGVVAQMYPKEPLLDVDYIHDSNNPLDNFHWGPKTLTSTLPPTPPPATPPPAIQSSQSSDEAAVAEAAATAAEIAAEVGATKGQVSTLVTCTTSQDRLASWFSETAVEGTPCIFGVDPRDEGNHCIVDANQKYGSFGWCWTNKDKTEWGSCSESCPFFGPTKKLLLKVDRFASVVGHWRDLLAQQKAAQQAATAAAAVTLPPTLNEKAASEAAAAAAGVEGAQSALQSATAPPQQLALGAAPEQGAFQGQAPAEPIGQNGMTRNLLNQPTVHSVAQAVREVPGAGRPTALLANEKRQPTMSLKDLLRLAAKEAASYSLDSDIALFQVSTIAKRPSMNHYCTWDEARDAACA